MKDFLKFGGKAIRVSSIVFLERKNAGDATRFFVYLAGIASPVDLLLRGDEAAKLNAFFEEEGTFDESMTAPVFL
jgi:hypothetical protein